MSNATEELIRQLDGVRRFNSEQLELYNKVVEQNYILLQAWDDAVDYIIYLRRRVNSIDDEEFKKACNMHLDSLMTLRKKAIEKVEENKNET